MESISKFLGTSLKSVESAGSPTDSALKEEAGPDGNPTDRQPARAHRQPGDRHVLAQAAHAAHVLLMMHAVNY